MSADTITIGGEETVNRMGFGAMRITGPGIWGDPPDLDATRSVLRRVLELGLNFIDTAHAYAASERIIGETLAPYPDGVVVATKTGLYRTGPNQWPADGRPETIRRETDESLRLLRVDRLDLQQLHRVDPAVPLEESVGTLKELRDEGNIRHVGLSNVDVDQLRRAQEIVPIVSVQNEYNLGDRRSDPVLEACEAEGIAFLPWRPLDGGVLSEPGGPLDEVARKHGSTPGQVALAWLLKRSPVMLPIPGTNSVEHLEENVAAAGLELDDDDLAALR